MIAIKMSILKIKKMIGYAGKNDAKCARN